MLHFIFSTWIGGVCLGAWIIGFILSAERFQIFDVKDRTDADVVGRWLAAVFWPVPTLYRWGKNLASWAKSAL